MMSEKYKMTVNIDFDVDDRFSKVCAALGVSKTEQINFLISKDLDKYERLHRELSAAFGGISTEGEGVSKRALI
jgi:hypothetical protein